MTQAKFGTHRLATYIASCVILLLISAQGNYLQLLHTQTSSICLALLLKLLRLRSKFFCLRGIHAASCRRKPAKACMMRTQTRAVASNLSNCQLERGSCLRSGREYY